MKKYIKLFEEFTNEAETPREKLDRIMKSEKERVDKLLGMDTIELLIIANKGKDIGTGKFHGFNEQTPKQEIIDFILENDLDLFHSI